MILYYDDDDGDCDYCTSFIGVFAFTKNRLRGGYDGNRSLAPTAWDLDDAVAPGKTFGKACSIRVSTCFGLDHYGVVFESVRVNRALRFRRPDGFCDTELTGFRLKRICKTRSGNDAKADEIRYCHLFAVSYNEIDHKRIMSV